MGSPHSNGYRRDTGLFTNVPAVVFTVAERTRPSLLGGHSVLVQAARYRGGVVRSPPGRCRLPSVRL